MRATVSNRVRVSGAPPAVAREINTRLTLRNPEHTQRERAGADLEETPETVSYCVHDQSTDPHTLIVPRGALDVVRAAARRARVELQTVDRTLAHRPTGVTFTGSLRLYQEVAAATLLRRWSGVLDAPTGSGKTVVGLAMIAHRAQPTLVLVPTTKLLEQWLEEIPKFLDGVGKVGIIGGGKCILGDNLAVGLIDSVAPRIKDLQQSIGHLVVDECHRAPGERYSRTISALPARYRLGLSATPWRRDGLTQVVNWLLGPTTKIDRGPLVESGAILPADIEQRPTDFATELDASAYYQEVIEEVIGNQDRNLQIAADIARERGPGVRLLLSDRRMHCNILAAYLQARHGITCAKLKGGMSKKKTAYYHDALEQGRIRHIVATAQFVGEGWDFPRVGMLALTTPIKFDGKLIQAIGRALRPCEGMDRARILDYVDRNVPVLRASARTRAETYRKGIQG